uniref:Fe2OG dioxygenase domain-containing protein n=1 Tax=Kalanchoe fedtschenkoi TaxID=63787 RepID=A0A7N0T1E4_KALFE
MIEDINCSIDLTRDHKKKSNSAKSAAGQFMGLDKAGSNDQNERKHTKNVRDWKEVFDYSSTGSLEIPASDDPFDDALLKKINQWPENPPEFKEASEEYVCQTEKLAVKLVELISLSLGLGADRLKGFFEKETSFVRINHYPPCPEPHLALGVGRHTDAGAVTVLAQDDVGGLEVKRKTDGEWIAVQPIPNAYIINIGNIMQIWSNAEYESPEHRAILNPEKDRISIPFFFNPAHYIMVEPLEELISDERPSKYKAYNWGKFFASRNRTNLQKLNVENIQIDHFKVAG